MLSRIRYRLSRLKSRWIPQRPSTPGPEDARPLESAPADDVAQAADEPMSTSEAHPQIPAAHPLPPPPLPPWAALHLFRTPGRGRRRVTLILDTLPEGTVPDAQTAAPVLGVLLAHRCRADLRIVTRDEPADPARLRALLSLLGIPDAAIDGEIQFRFLPIGNDKAELDLIENELLLTDTWWNAWAALAAAGHAQVVHLIRDTDPAAEAGEDARLHHETLMSRSDLQHLPLPSVLAQKPLREPAPSGFDVPGSRPARAGTPRAVGAGSAGVDGETDASWQAALEPLLSALARRV